MTRLCTDVSAICNRKSWIPVAGCHTRAIFVLRLIFIKSISIKQITLTRHFVNAFILSHILTLTGREFHGFTPEY